MSNIEPNPTLFDAESYAMPEMQIPYLLGFPPGDFDDNRTQYVTVTTNPGYLYTTTGKNEQHHSLEYAAESDNFRTEFRYWRQLAKVRGQEYTGYVGGCPVITTPEGRQDIAIHLWSFNASVLDDSYAIPLVAIRSIHRYSAFRRSLQLDADELSMGDVDSAFEITTKNERTGEVQSRQAEPEDIQHLIAMTDRLEEPELIYEADKRTNIPFLRRPELMFGREVVEVDSKYL